MVSLRHEIWPEDARYHDGLPLSAAFLLDQIIIHGLKAGAAMSAMRMACLAVYVSCGSVSCGQSRCHGHPPEYVVSLACDLVCHMPRQATSKTCPEQSEAVPVSKACSGHCCLKYAVVQGVNPHCTSLKSSPGWTRHQCPSRWLLAALSQQLHPVLAAVQ